MYQIAIRRIAPEVKVFDFAFGSITDGHFVPSDVNILPAEILGFVCVSDLLSSQAYVHVGRLTDLVKTILSVGASMELYPNFIIFALPEGYVTKKEKE